MKLLTSQVANLIISYVQNGIAINKEIESKNAFTITDTQLHKMVYVVYAHFMLLTGLQLTTERPKVSKKGPYFEDLRSCLQGYKRYSPEFIVTVDPITELPTENAEIPEIVHILAKDVFDQVKNNKILCAQLSHYLMGSPELWAELLEYAHETGDVYIPDEKVKQLLKVAIERFSSDVDAQELFKQVA